MATYSAIIEPSSASVTAYTRWAQFIGQGLNLAGWTAQSGHGEVVASGSGTSRTFTNVTAASTTAHRAQTNYSFKGAFVANTTYTGISTTINQSNVDLVTFGGLTYAHLTTTSNLATTPDQDATNWAVINYEIWLNGSTNCPVYMKLVYCGDGNGTPGPMIHLSFGSSVNANGVLGGNTATLSLAAPTSVLELGPGGGAGTTGLSVCLLSGDANNCAIAMFCGGTLSTGGASSAYPQVWVVDMAKNLDATDSDGFAFIAIDVNQQGFGAGARVTRSYLSMGSGLGGVVNTQSTVSTNQPGWGGILRRAQFGGTVKPGHSCFGSIQAYPILPTPGYLANPQLRVVGFDNQATGPELNVHKVYSYGAVRTYIVVRNLNAATGINSETNGLVPAILWA
jgi:hypothetical protein